MLNQFMMRLGRPNSVNSDLDSAEDRGHINKNNNINSSGNLFTKFCCPSTTEHITDYPDKHRLTNKRNKINNNNNNKMNLKNIFKKNNKNNDIHDDMISYPPQQLINAGSLEEQRSISAASLTSESSYISNSNIVISNNIGPILKQQSSINSIISEERDHEYAYNHNNDDNKNENQINNENIDSHNKFNENRLIQQEQHEQQHRQNQMNHNWKQINNLSHNNNNNNNQNIDNYTNKKTKVNKKLKQLQQIEVDMISFTNLSDDNDQELIQQEDIKQQHENNINDDEYYTNKNNHDDNNNHTKQQHDDNGYYNSLHKKSVDDDTSVIDANADDFRALNAKFVISKSDYEQDDDEDEIENDDPFAADFIGNTHLTSMTSFTRSRSNGLANNVNKIDINNKNHLDDDNVVIVNPLFPPSYPATKLTAMDSFKVKYK